MYLLRAICRLLIYPTSLYVFVVNSYYTFCTLFIYDFFNFVIGASFRV